MPLTTCPECQARVSTEAKVCPHCGYPRPGLQRPARPVRRPMTELERKRFRLLVRIALVAFVAVVVVGTVIEFRREARQPDPYQQPSAAGPDLGFTPGEPIRILLPQGETRMEGVWFTRRANVVTAYLADTALWTQDETLFWGTLGVLLPEVYGDDLWERIPGNAERETRRGTGLLRYTLDDGKRVYVLPVREPDEGWVAFSTWGEQ